VLYVANPTGDAWIVQKHAGLYEQCTLWQHRKFRFETAGHSPGSAFSVQAQGKPGACHSAQFQFQALARHVATVTTHCARQGDPPALHTVSFHAKRNLGDWKLQQSLNQAEIDNQCMEELNLNAEGTAKSCRFYGLHRYSTTLEIICVNEVYDIVC